MDKKQNLKEFIYCIIFAILLVIIDRLSKLWAIKNLKDSDAIWIIKNVLQLYYLPNGNKGAAWGMLEGHQLLFVFIAVIVLIVIGYIIFNLPVGKKYLFIKIMLTFIAAGGVGNMYDRIVQGYVVDFIYFSIINFPIFNVADIYVSVCTILFALYLIFKVNDDELAEIENILKKPFKKEK